jgi:alpha-D-ribose 1-methylphosphonate 5-triphosphate synthase subunit PhnI
MRRIVPAYGNPPGPQLLGHTTDYAGRLLDFDEGEHRARAKSDADTHPAREPMVRLSEVLREQDLLIDRRLDDDDEAVDIMVDPWVTPAPRSARLAVLSRGETGALVNLWYQGVMGPKAIFHEITLGEVRHGHLPVAVKHPYCGETVDLGEIRVTEVEAIEDTDGRAEDTTKFDAGYGFVIGHNERKAIAMSVLDISIERAQGSELEQRVLATCDGLESTGFLEHLKLPHYVTFRSIVERKLRRRSTAPVAEPSLPGPGPAR